MIFTLSFTFKTSVYVAVLFICFCTKPFSKFCRHVAVNKCLFTVVACYLFLRLFIAFKQFSLDANICCNIPYALSQFFLSLHTSYFQRGLMCYKIGEKNETSIWAAGTHVDLLLGFLCSINTKISDQIEFSLCRIHLSSCWIVSSLFYWLNLCRIDSSSSLIKVLNVYNRAAVVLGNDLATPTPAIEGRSGVSSIDFNVVQ